ncbi:unnamed protein product [Clavelina lepadiformis]|uniref:FYVE-type domain-containing protein n=1 Tax=Clavelina lepadiformis TaxID=159417 RepID=A0ABP0FB29_CLALP
MEDPFFAAASDLDKILDDFEESEEPRKGNADPVHSKCETESAVEKPIFKKSDAHVEKTTTEIAPSAKITRKVLPQAKHRQDTVQTNNATDKENQTNVESTNNRVLPMEENNLLIDFSSSETLAPRSSSPLQTSEKTIHGLDFLVPLVSGQKDTQFQASVSNAKTHSQVLLDRPTKGLTMMGDSVPSNHITASMSDGAIQKQALSLDIETTETIVCNTQLQQPLDSANKVSQLSESSSTNKILLNSAKEIASNQPVGFQDHIQIDDSEFQQFMEEEIKELENIEEQLLQQDSYRQDTESESLTGKSTEEKCLENSKLVKVRLSTPAELNESSSFNPAVANDLPEQCHTIAPENHTEKATTVTHPKMKKIISQSKSSNKAFGQTSSIPTTAEEQPTDFLGKDIENRSDTAPRKNPNLKLKKESPSKRKHTTSLAIQQMDTEMSTSQNMQNSRSSQDDAPTQNLSSQTHVNGTSFHSPNHSQSENISDESSQSEPVGIGVNEERKIRRLHSVSPPSYSSVIAGDYAAGTIIQHDPAFTSHHNDQFSVAPSAAVAITPSENHTNSTQVEHGIEATEESAEDVARHGQTPDSESVLRAAAIAPTIYQSQTQRPGRVKPHWVPDQESPVCTKCRTKFTFTKRRHHCRACGRIFCSQCCSEKSKLEYLNNAEARVCVRCYQAVLQADVLASTLMVQNDGVLMQPSSPIAVPGTSSNSSPRPALRHQDNGSDGNDEPKSVRFSDGTRPDHPAVLPATPPLPTRLPRSKQRSSNGTRVPHHSFLPPVIMEYSDDGSYIVDEEPDPDFVLTLLRSGGVLPVTFALSPNLLVLVKLFRDGLSSFYYFLSLGLDSVGQAEVAILMQTEPSNDSIPYQAFNIYSHLFNIARKGKAIHAMDFIPCSDIWESTDNLFGSSEYAGLLFVRRTCQKVENLLSDTLDTRMPLVSNTVNFSAALFAVLVLKCEVPWAKLVPSRLLLGLGAKYKQYPYPLLNPCKRQPVYFEVGNTILGILCDFRNYKYKVVSVPGLSVLVKNSGVVINIPANRFTDIVKIMNSSNEHVLALGAETFIADDNCRSHLVCVEDQATHNYNSEIITYSSPNDEELTSGVGATFVVFNGSLKSGTAQQAKCTVVEDGIMIQLLPEKMAVFKDSLKAMDDFIINCNSSSTSSPAKQPIKPQDSNVPEEMEENPNEAGNEDEEVSPSLCRSVEVRWVGDDTKFNIGLSSPIDSLSFEGIVGFNVQGKSEKKGKRQVLRWNQVFFFRCTNDILDMSRLAEKVANGCFQALIPHVVLLRNSSMTKIGVRINIHPDDVGYAVGSHELPLPDPCLNALDDCLIPLVHEASANLQVDDEPVSFELIFSILDMKSSWKIVPK